MSPTGASTASDPSLITPMNWSRFGSSAVASAVSGVGAESGVSAASDGSRPSPLAHRGRSLSPILAGRLGNRSLLRSILGTDQLQDREPRASPGLSGDLDRIRFGLELEEEHVHLVLIGADHGFHGGDLAADYEAVFLQAGLEFLPSGGDTALTFQLDPSDLAVRPRVDRVHVLFGKFAKVLGLKCLAGPDAVDVRLSALLRCLGVARSFRGGCRLHRLGEIGQERRLLDRIPMIGSVRAEGVGRRGRGFWIDL